jgi:hypothetical protein
MPRERDRGQAVEELPHAVAAQRDLAADRHPLAELELGDGLARPRDRRALARDHGELLDGLVERLGVLLGLAHAHAEGDLLEARVLHRGPVAELLLELRPDLLLVGRLESRGGALVRRGHQSSFSPERAETRTRLPSISWIRTRVGR